MARREPEVALAASPRDWAQRLHRHLADHGGARVRATILHEQDALAERYDVLVVDDTTSYVTRRLVTELQRTGRRVLGVFDPDDPRGKAELADIGVDAVLAHTAATGEFLATVTALANEAVRSTAGAATARHAPAPAPAPAPPAAPAPPRASGRITAVGAPPGGCGATEVAIGLAAGAGWRGEPCVLVDADEVAPCLAQRLALPTYPNLRAAVDAAGKEAADLADVLVAVESGGFWALPGPARASDWPQLRGTDVVTVARRLARPGVHVVANVARCGPDAAGEGSSPAATRMLLAAADALVGVGAATPVGVTRLLEWVAEVVQVAPATPLHLVVNRTPTDGFKRAELEGELCRNVSPATLTFVPADRRVEAAAWASSIVAPGAFSRALEPLVEVLLPPATDGTARRRQGAGLRRLLAPARGAVTSW